jgi:AraC-like DNA-binding protein
MQKSDVKILPIGDFGGPLAGGDVYVNTLKEHLRLHHARVEKPHKHDFFAVMLFSAGSGTHTIDFTQYRVEPGSVFIMAPGQVHSWDLSKDVDGFVVFHTRPFLDRNSMLTKAETKSFFSFAQYPSAVQLSKTASKSIQSRIQQIAAENQGHEFGKNEYMRLLIEQIYLELARAFISAGRQGEKQSPYYHKYLEFENLLEANFRTMKSASAYADRLHVSAKHLNRIVRSVIGKSTSEAILDRVILEAQRMLIHSEKNFAEIADGLGFEDYSYFSHVFKKKTGKSPSDFLKDISG